MAQLGVLSYKAQPTEGAQVAGEAKTLKRVSTWAALPIGTNRDRIWYEFNRFSVQSINKKAWVGKKAPSPPRAINTLTSGNMIKMYLLI